MSNKGLAKVSRRRFNLETVVFSAEQEVTVPAGIKIPADTQYLLHPVLIIPKDKNDIYQGLGKIRFQGQLEGFLSCVDSEEAVHTLAVPPIEFMTAFATPLLADARFEADAVIEGVELDRGGDDVANLTVFVIVTVRALRNEETELITAVSKDFLGAEVRNGKFQNIAGVEETEQVITIDLPATVGRDPIGKDLGIGNLNWQVIEGRLSAEGVVMAKVYSLSVKGELEAFEANKEFELELDFDAPEVTDSKLLCAPIKSRFYPGTEEEGPALELVLRFTAIGYFEQTTEYIASLSGADSIEKMLYLRNRIGESEFKFNLGGVCQFPKEPAKVDLVLAKTRITEAKALDEQVLVRGLLSLSIFYTDESDLPRVLVQEEEFNQFFALKGCASGYSVKAWAWPEKGSCSDERYSVPILLRVEVVEEVEFRAVADVHVVDTQLAPAAASVVLYVAKEGDSLFAVARKFNITMEKLREYNGLPADAVIYRNQKLLIPTYQAKYYPRV
jgi:LysM repeat protein